MRLALSKFALALILVGSAWGQIYNPAVAGGSGTVTSFSAGTLSPLFTTSVATSTSTPALTFSLTNAGAGTLFGNPTGAPAAPSFTLTPVLGLAGTSVGTLGFANATSGSIVFQPVTGALGSTVITLPAATGTAVVATTSTTTTQALFATATGGAPAFRAIAAGDIPVAIPIGNVGSAGLSGTSPVTISAAGAIGCATCTTNAAALTSNAVVKGAGGQAAAADATLSDDGTTLAYTGTAIQTPQGACASTPALKFGSTGTVGISQGGAAAQIGLTDGTLCRFLFVVGAAMTERMGGAGILGWTSTAGDASGTIDTTLSRSGINHVQVGSTTNNSNGGVDAAGFFSKGTTFTGNAGCSETTLTGGATAGKFTAVSTSCTIIVTMGNSMAAPTGWDCNVQDLTTAADAHNPRQSASTTTTATFITGTIVSSDVISFHCVGY